jgi:hypothetical protein
MIHLLEALDIVDTGHLHGIQVCLQRSQKLFWRAVNLPSWSASFQIWTCATLAHLSIATRVRVFELPSSSWDQTNQYCSNSCTPLPGSYS